MSLEFMSMKVQMQMYYTDGYMYMDAMGQKTKEAMPIEDAMKVFGGMSDMSGDMITEIKTEKVEGGTKYTPTIDEANMMDYVGSLLEKAKDTMGGAGNAEDYMDDVNIKNLQTYIIVGNDGYISEQWMSMDLDADVEEAEATDVSMSMEMTNTFVDPGKDVTVTLPDDLDEYTLKGSDI